MERPVKPTFEKYPIFEDYMSACGQWEHDIEEYCNYLEQSYKSMQATVNKLKKGIEEYNEKLQKIWIALDKACEKLEYCSKERGVFNVTCDKQYWKERFMKGEKSIEEYS